MSESEFRQRARVVSRTNRKEADVGNIVVELTRGMHGILMNEGRVINWSACNHRCLTFGRMMRE